MILYRFANEDFKGPASGFGGFELSNRDIIYDIRGVWEDIKDFERDTDLCAFASHQNRLEVYSNGGS